MVTNRTILRTSGYPGRLGERHPAMHLRLRRLVLVGSIACVPALGTLLGLAGTATASTAVPQATRSTPGTASAQAAAAARNAIRKLVVGEHGTDHAVSGHALAHPARSGVSALNQVSSTNWAGYADDSTGGHTYSKITGNWTEPSASCTSTESLAAFWIGIAAYPSSSVEQAGTLIECYRSAATTTPGGRCTRPTPSRWWAP